MKKASISYGTVVLFFIVLAAIVFRCAIGEGKIFSASDGNIGTLAKQHRDFPAHFSGSFTATPLLGSAGSAPITPIRIGAWLMSPEVFSDTWYSIYLVTSSMFLIAFLRLWNLRWSSSIFGALAAFWVGSITMSSAGHLGKFGVMTYFTIALYLLEKGVRSSSMLKRIALGALTGFVVALMLLDQQDVGLLAGLFLGPYVLIRLFQCYLKKPLVWVQLLLPVAVIGLGLTLSTAQKAYSANVTEAGLSDDPQQKWNFITQWSMVPAEFPELIAPGYMGWSTGNPEGPYWGECGQSAEWKSTGKGFRNFRLDNPYIGIIPVSLAVVGALLAFGKRKENKEESVLFLCWAVMALLAFSLALGKYSILYKAFYHLPLVGNIRAPAKFVHNLQVVIGILSAYGLNEILTRPLTAPRLLKNLAFALLGLTVLFVLLALFPQTVKFSEWGQYQDVIVGNIQRAWFHAGIMAGLLSGGLFLLLKKDFALKRVLPFVLIALVAFDSVYLTSHYFKSDDVSSYKEGNAVLSFLKENQGNERVYFLDSKGPYNNWTGIDGPYHGLNIFNIWQMPRMSQEYKNFLAAAGSNLPRLWQLASCRYVTAPAGIINAQNIRAGLQPVMFYRFAMQGEKLLVLPLAKPEQESDQVLLEFKNHVPRFSLFHDWKKVPREKQCEILFSNEIDPLRTVLLDESAPVPAHSDTNRFQRVSAEINLKKAVVRTSAEKSGILMFSQYWQPGWTVEIDGVPADLLRCNYLCLGVHVPSGEHEVVFRCPGK